MGAHGVSPFQDDDGADFVAEIIKAKDLAVIADAVYSIPDSDDEYIEAPTATRALVAAEVIVFQFGRESGDFTDELQDWIEGQDDPDQILIERTRRAVKRILRDSELRELWKESQLLPEWEARTQSLLKRLG